MEDITLFWKINSSRHAWSTDFLSDFIKMCSDNSLINNALWVRKKWGDKPSVIAIQKEKISENLSKFIKSKKNIDFSIGGDNPKWEILWNTYPFDNETDFVDGLNTLFFEFTISKNQVDEISKKLTLFFQYFCKNYPIEYATIHEYRSWVVDSVEKPITIAPMFKSVFWANFIGKGHIEEFDIEKLQILPFAIKEKYENGYCFFVEDHLEKILYYEFEPKRITLTEEVRKCLKNTSRWI